MEVTNRTVITLTKKEATILSDLISNLYDINDDDNYISQVMNDIFNARFPVEKEASHKYEGDRVTVIVTQ